MQYTMCRLLFWIFLFNFFVILEAFERTSGGDVNGGCSEGGAHSEGTSLCLYFCLSVSRVVSACLVLLSQDPQDSLVVLSGCGTSGRMAFLITVNVVLKCSPT